MYWRNDKLFRCKQNARIGVRNEGYELLLQFCRL